MLLTLAGVCVLALPPVATLLALMKPAVCWSEGRILSDRELADAYIRKGRLNEHTISGGEIIDRGYPTVESFRAANPNCCHVVRWTGRPPGEVGFKETAFLDQWPLLRLIKPYDVLIDGWLVDACGRIIKNAPGGGVL